MSDRPWRSISLPSGLLEEIEVFLKEHPEYLNTSDFIKEAIRKRLRQLRKETKVGIPAS